VVGRKIDDESEAKAVAWAREYGDDPEQHHTGKYNLIAVPVVGGTLYIENRTNEGGLSAASADPEDLVLPLA
jgi:hypothetical protein